MKQIVTGILALVLFIGTAEAQSKRGGGKQHPKKEATADKRLNLTSEQRERIQSLHEAQKQEMEALKNASLTVDQRNAKRKEIHQKYKDQYAAILTPEQKEQVKDKKSPRAKDDKGTGYRGLGNINSIEKRADYYAKELNLSAEQKSSLLTLLSDFRTRSEAIRSNTSLTNEQKKDQIRALSQQYIQQGEGLLTADQLTKLQNMNNGGFKRKK